MAKIDINQFLRIWQRLIRQHLQSIANKLKVRRVHGQGREAIGFEREIVALETFCLLLDQGEIDNAEIWMAQ